MYIQTKLFLTFMKSKRGAFPPFRRFGEFGRFRNGLETAPIPLCMASNMVCGHQSALTDAVPTLRVVFLTRCCKSISLQVIPTAIALLLVLCLFPPPPRR
jgi:hypothetical protein